MLRGHLRAIAGGRAAPKRPPVADWRAALERVADAYAETTLAAHRRDLEAYERWCAEAGYACIPASAEQVAAFVQATLEHCAVRTIARRLHVIGRVHQWLELPDPTSDQLVKIAYRAAVKRRAKPPRQALGLSAELRNQLLAACPETLLGLRDRAMISVGYDTLCRRSELVRLRVEDLTPLADGSAKVLVAQSKNDPLSEGRFAYLSARGRDDLQAWLRAAGITAGAIFRAVHDGQIGAEAMNPRIVNRTIQAAAVRAGLAPEVVKQLSGHSLRVGAAQDLAIQGRSVLQIMRAGRWYSLNGMMGYVRKADVNVWGAVR